MFGSEESIGEQCLTYRTWPQTCQHQWLHYIYMHNVYIRHSVEDILSYNSKFHMLPYYWPKTLQLWPSRSITALTGSDCLCPMPSTARRVYSASDSALTVSRPFYGKRPPPGTVFTEIRIFARHEDKATNSKFKSKRALQT